MPNRENFPAIFAQLRAIFQPFAPALVVKEDGSESHSLDAPASAKYPNGLFFGAVQQRKNYVSYHLMPVYVFPDLLDGVSDRLKKRMQGKSCFNFTSLDQGMVEELTRLTEAGFGRYREAQLLQTDGSCRPQARLHFDASSRHRLRA